MKDKQIKTTKTEEQNKLIIKYHQINQSASLQIELNHTFSLTNVAMKTAKNWIHFTQSTSMSAREFTAAIIKK